MKVLLSLLVFAFTIPSYAQSDDSRFTLGAGFLVSQPRGEFHDNVGTGFGAGGNVLFHVDREGWFSLGFDGSWLQYGSETKRVPFSQTVGGRVLVDVTTTNSIVTLGGGPEFAVPRGIIRPYVNAGFAGLLFQTISSVEGIRTTDEAIASTTNLSDWTRAWVMGGGVRIPLPRRDSRFSLDLGARYYRGGEALYLTEGSIFDNPDGSITLFPFQSRTPFIVYSVGFRFRIPRN